MLYLPHARCEFEANCGFVREACFSQRRKQTSRSAVIQATHSVVAIHAKNVTKLKKRTIQESYKKAADQGKHEKPLITRCSATVNPEPPP
jgi:hypothetical protein